MLLRTAFLSTAEAIRIASSGERASANVFANDTFLVIDRTNLEPF